MKTCTLTINKNLATALQSLARAHNISEAEVIRRGLTLLSLADEKEADGYDLAFYDKETNKLVRKVILS